jgi:hypothetical protein
MAASIIQKHAASQKVNGGYSGDLEIAVRCQTARGSNLRLKGSKATIIIYAKPKKASSEKDLKERCIEAG